MFEEEFVMSMMNIIVYCVAMCWQQLGQDMSTFRILQLGRWNKLTPSLAPLKVYSLQYNWHYCT